MTLFLLAVLLTFSTMAAPQDTSATPTFRVASNEVVIEFIAVDKETGRFVADLSLDEVVLKIDGKKQKIRRLLQPSQIDSGLDQVIHATPVSETTDIPDQSASEPSKRTVILLDSRTLDAANFHHSVSAIRRFISESLRTRHQVMMAEIDPGLKVLTPFTQDQDRLLQAVQSLRPATVYNPLDPSRLTSGVGEQYFDELQKQVQYLRSALRLLCHSLSSLPGRKHVVLFSEGYSLNPNQDLEISTGHATAFASADDRQAASRRAFSRKDPGVLSMVTETVGLANIYGVTFYTVDARGLTAVPGIGQADVAGDLAAGPGESVTGRNANLEFTEAGPTEVSLTTFQLTNLGSLDDAHNMLTALAGGTNGSAFYNSNDLGAVLRASTREQDYAYLAGFSAQPKGKPKFRRVRVECSRPGVVIRSQIGYLDQPPRQALGARLLEALANPGYFQYLEPILEMDPGQNQIIIGLPGRQIAGRRKGEQVGIEVLFAGRAYDSSGKPVSDKYEINRGFQLDLSSEQFQSLAQQPLLARQEISLAPGTYSFRLAVEDRVAGTLGVRVAELTVP